MAILNVLRGRAGLGAALALLGCLAAGCALLEVFTGKPFVFDHKVHLNPDLPLECGSCHAGWENSDQPGMPSPGVCALCHDARDKDKPPDRKVAALFDGEVYKAQRVAKLGGDVKFSHQRHATSPETCSACHRGIETNTRVDGSLAVSMTACVDCHGQQKIANECATCHDRIRVDVAPDSHAFQWQRLHGPTVRAQSAATANDCRLCHEESTCRTCHEATPPENHSEHFRRRGHGLLASMDRQNCAACHRSDSCDACHQDTRPVGHSGQWARGANTHCVGCHLPIQDNQCFTCHRTPPAHATAPTMPPTHAPGMNCRQCHGNGQPLLHVDKGDDCGLCHR